MTTTTERYTFTDDISQWLADNAREIAEHLWAPNLGSGWKAWLYVDDEGEIQCSYNTSSTSPNPVTARDVFITNVWTEIDGDFDDEYSEVDFIADYIFQGSLDPQDA